MDEDWEVDWAVPEGNADESKQNGNNGLNPSISEVDDEAKAKIEELEEIEVVKDGKENANSSIVAFEGLDPQTVLHLSTSEISSIVPPTELSHVTPSEEHTTPPPASKTTHEDDNTSNASDIDDVDNWGWAVGDMDDITETPEQTTVTLEQPSTANINGDAAEPETVHAHEVLKEGSLHNQHHSLETPVSNEVLDHSQPQHVAHSSPVSPRQLRPRTQVLPAALIAVAMGNLSDASTSDGEMDTKQEESGAENQIEISQSSSVSTALKESLALLPPPNVDPSANIPPVGEFGHVTPDEAQEEAMDSVSSPEHLPYASPCHDDGDSPRSRTKSRHSKARPLRARKKPTTIEVPEGFFDEPSATTSPAVGNTTIPFADTSFLLPPPASLDDISSHGISQGSLSLGFLPPPPDAEPETKPAPYEPTSETNATHSTTSPPKVPNSNTESEAWGDDWDNWEDATQTSDQAAASGATSTTNAVKVDESEKPSGNGPILANQNNDDDWFSDSDENWQTNAPSSNLSSEASQNDPKSLQTAPITPSTSTESVAHSSKSTPLSVQDLSQAVLSLIQASVTTALAEATSSGQSSAAALSKGLVNGYEQAINTLLDARSLVVQKPLDFSSTLPSTTNCKSDAMKAYMISPLARYREASHKTSDSVDQDLHPLEVSESGHFDHMDAHAPNPLQFEDVNVDSDLKEHERGADLVPNEEFEEVEVEIEIEVEEDEDVELDSNEVEAIEAALPTGNVVTSGDDDNLDDWAKFDDEPLSATTINAASSRSQLPSTGPLIAYTSTSVATVSHTLVQPDTSLVPLTSIPQPPTSLPRSTQQLEQGLAQNIPVNDIEQEILEGDEDNWADFATANPVSPVAQPRVVVHDLVSSPVAAAPQLQFGRSQTSIAAFTSLQSYLESETYRNACTWFQKS